MHKNELLKLPNPLIFKDGSSVNAENWQKRRREIIKILEENIYGITPPPVDVFVEIKEENNSALAGKARHLSLNIRLAAPLGDFCFPLNIHIPKNVEKPQMLLYISFEEHFPNKYYPIEEICDNGFASAIFCYKKVCSDDADFSNGLAAVFPSDREGERGKTQWGKIGMWAYAASRALDYLMTLDEIDTSKISVIGHSRLGKTALWAGAQDERFYCAISNDSGCSGASIARNRPENAENIAKITERFPYWFCAAYKDYVDKENTLPFDQHFLTCAIAPRRVYIASAIEDLWACPQNEYLCAVETSKFYKALGEGDAAFMPQDDFNSPFDIQSGKIAYHLRTGTHFWRRPARRGIWGMVKKC